MPVVRLNDGTFDDLSVIARWTNVKSPVEAIELIVREKMDSLGLERDVDGAPRVHTAGAAPGLSFTRVLSATVDGRSLSPANWANLLIATIEAVSRKLGVAGKELSQHLQVRARPGRHEDEGFKFQERLGISVQGQSAQDAWKEVDRLARKYGVPVEVEFQWYDNPKASRPGQTGQFKVS